MVRRLVVAACAYFLSLSVSANIFFEVKHKDRLDLPPSYLLGTMHMVCKSNFSTPDKVLLSLVAAEQLIVEVNLDDPVQQAAARNAMFQEPSDYLANYLNADEYRALDQQVQKHIKTPLEEIDMLRPLVLGAMLLSHYLPCDSEIISVDQAMLALATSWNRPVVGLETAKWQFELFDYIDLGAQVSALLELATDEVGTQTQLEYMADTYLRGNGQELHQFMIAQDDFLGATPLFLNQRNQAWTKHLVKMLAVKRSFIAVGAGHLYGEQGLLALLKANGYEVTPVPVSFHAVRPR